MTMMLNDFDLMILSKVRIFCYCSAHFDSGCNSLQTVAVDAVADDDVGCVDGGAGNHAYDFHCFGPLPPYLRVRPSW